MKNVIVFDLDGTLRDGAHRLHLLPKENLDRTESWDAFNLACRDDAPIWDNIHLLDMVSAVDNENLILILTSCSDVAHDITMDWLLTNGVYFDGLIMRPRDDHRSDTEFKEAKLREIGLDRILCCFDDNPRVVRHIRSLGLTCHEVRHYENPRVHEA